MKKTIPTTIIILVIVAFAVMTQIKVPLCYEEPSPPELPTFVIYDKEIINQVRSELERDPFYFLRVRGKSMKPSIEEGQKCVCIRQYSYDEGDIVVFYVEKEKDKVELVSHRIKLITADGKIITQGDNNPFPDPWRITEEQILCKIPETSILEKFRFIILKT